MRWWPLLLLLPVVQAGILQEQHTRLDLASQAPNVVLLGGDIGTPNLGASGTSAAPAVALPLVADDFLRLDATTTTWEVHAELVSQSGWAVTESITISLDDGTLLEPQIDITLGVVTQTVGLDVALPAVDTQVLVSGLGTGTLSFDLVLTPPSGGVEVRYRIDLSA